MWNRVRGIIGLCLLVTITVLAQLQPVYLEQVLPQHSTALVQCAQSSTEGTLRTFFRDSATKCPKEPYQLIELYDRMLQQVGDEKCHKLMVHHVRKLLIENSATRLSDALISLTPDDSEEIVRLSQRLSSMPAVMQAVWERAIDEVHLFADRELVTTTLLQAQALEALLYLNRKSQWAFNDNAMIKLANQLRAVRAQSDYRRSGFAFQAQVEAAYATLTPNVQVLYASTPIRLVNRQSYDYLIAAESADNRLLPFTWRGNDDNEKDVDGDRNLILEYRSNADISFATKRGSTLRHLYYNTEKRDPDFWLGSGKKLTRWWEVRENIYGVSIVNAETRKVLCMGKEVDDYRRSVELLPTAGNENVPKCSWAPIRVDTS